MHIQALFIAGLGLLGRVLAQDDEEPEPEPTPTPQPTLPVSSFANATVFQPDDASIQVTYARTVDLPNSTVLAAWSDPSAPSNSIAVFRSKDNGFSWYTFSNATSPQAGRKLIQPHLLFLNGTFGDEGEDIVVLAVNAVDEKSTNIELYASWDQGAEFDYMTTIARGGAPNATNGNTPVWEPFLLFHDGRLTCYYSDSRDTQHAQKIVQQTTMEHFYNWGTAIDVVSSQLYEDRPGKPSVVKLPNKYYLILFEYALRNGEGGTYTHPVYYKIVANPENAATEPIRELSVASGVKPSSAPFITWTSIGGDWGTLVVSDSTSNSIFVNHALGEGGWQEVPTTAGRAYSREVKIPANDREYLRFAGGAEEGQSSPSQILVTVMDFEAALRGPGRK